MTDPSEIDKAQIENRDSVGFEPEVDRRRQPRSPELDSDRRRARRQRVLLSGLVVPDDLSDGFACTIRNLSDGGARIALPEGVQLPPKFWLIRTTAGLAYKAAVAWQYKDLAGLELSEAFDLANPTTPTDAHLAQALNAARV